VPAQPNISGVWRGIAQPDNSKWTIQLTQTGSTLSGTIEVTLASDRTAETGTLLSSSVQGNKVHLESQLTRGDEKSPVTLRFDGTLNAAGNAMSGAWSDSTGGSGTVTLSRS
jgi:hypothetical protein